jgi:hypothetical protein
VEERCFSDYSVTSPRPNFYNFPRYKMDIPQYFATNKCKTVRTVDKTRMNSYLNCSQNSKGEKLNFPGFKSGYNSNVLSNCLNWNVRRYVMYSTPTITCKNNETLRISNIFSSFWHIYTHIILSFLISIPPLPPLTMLGECFQPTMRFSIVKSTLFWGEAGGE